MSRDQVSVEEELHLLSIFYPLSAYICNESHYVIIIIQREQQKNL